MNSKFKKKLILKIKLIIPNVESNKDLPLEYNVFVMNRHTRNTYVFAERDLKSVQNTSDQTHLSKGYHEKYHNPSKSFQSVYSISLE